MHYTCTPNAISSLSAGTLRLQQRRSLGTSHRFERPIEPFPDRCLAASQVGVPDAGYGDGFLRKGHLGHELGYLLRRRYLPLAEDKQLGYGREPPGDVYRRRPTIWSQDHSNSHRPRKRARKPGLARPQFHLGKFRRATYGDERVKGRPPSGQQET